MLRCRRDGTGRTTGSCFGVVAGRSGGLGAGLQPLHVGFLGFVFLPWTTLSYVLVRYNGMRGFD